MENQSPKNTLVFLLEYSQVQFTGCIKIRIAADKTWYVYLYFGKLIWATDETQASDRWQRQWQRQSKIKVEADVLSAVETAARSRKDCLDYVALIECARHYRLQGAQLMGAIHGAIAEALFDIARASAVASIVDSSQKAVSFQVKPDLLPSATVRLPSSWMPDTSEILNSALSHWQQWQKLGLGDYSPNDIPVIRDRPRLEERTSTHTYKNIMAVLAKGYSLRDLAVKLERDELSLASSLAPLICEGIIEMQAIEELRKPQRAISSPSRTSKFRPLVAVVDDSPQTQQLMEAIVTGAGCRYCGILDSVEALPILIERQPDLIFLYLVMPVMNGYELCERIRRIEQIAKVPVVMLTTNVIDRVRARMVEASECTSKPISSSEVTTLLQRYLNLPQTPQTTASNLTIPVSMHEQPEKLALAWL